MVRMLWVLSLFSHFSYSLVVVEAFLPPLSFTKMPLVVSHSHEVSSTIQYMISAGSPTTLPRTSPLPPHTFAGMVEQGLKEKFDEDKIQRVLTSWRLVEMGYEHREYVGPTDKSSEESNCHQYAPSYLPGLTAQEFWPMDAFPWAHKLQSKYKEIKEEFTRVALQDPDTLQNQGNNIWAGALSEDASSYGVGWKTLVLRDRGVWDPVNVNLFPETAKTIHDCGVPTTEVFFASMKPHSDIRPHSDFTNFVLTSHLPLKIPENGNNKCRLTIGDTTRQWIEGELMAFDTSIMHDAINESDEMRYILMMRVWHPDLTQEEQNALQFTYDCLLVPELVSHDPGKRFMAEQQIEAMHRFPDIKRGQSATQRVGSSITLGAGRKKKKQKVKPKGAAKGFGS